MNQRPRISLIAALASNRAIGKDNRLLWRLPADLQHFKRLTLNKPILMGRKTWESLPGLLPERVHIVLSRDVDYRADGCILVNSMEDGIAAAGAVPELMVVGGAAIYQRFLPLADRMYLTLVDGEFEADAYFPEWNPDEWRESGRETRPADDKNPLDVSFVTLERIG